MSLSSKVFRTFSLLVILCGFAVLGDEVTGVAGEHHSGHLPLATGAEGDHFVDANKMVRLCCHPHSHTIPFLDQPEGFVR